MDKENDSRVALAFDPGNEALARCFEKTLLENRLKRREHEKEPKDIAWRHRHLSPQIVMTVRLKAKRDLPSMHHLYLLAENRCDTWVRALAVFVLRLPLPRRHRWRHLSYTWNGHRVRRELPVQHRTGRSSCAQVVELVRFKWSSGMFGHKRPLFYERHPWWWRRVLCNSAWSSGRQQTAVRTCCRWQGFGIRW